MEKTLFDEMKEYAAETTYRQLYEELKVKYEKLEAGIQENQRKWQQAAEAMNQERIKELQAHIKDLRAIVQYYTTINGDNDVD